MTVRLRFHTLVLCLWCLAGCASTIGRLPAPEVPRLARDQVAATVQLDVRPTSSMPRTVRPVRFFARPSKLSSSRTCAEVSKPYARRSRAAIRDGS